MGQFGEITQLLLLLMTVALTEGRICYSCQNIPHPRDCGRITQCGPDEDCFVEGLATSSGNILYNSGCSSTAQCLVKTVGKRATNGHDQDISLYERSNEGHEVDHHKYDAHSQKRADLPVCHQCCNNSNYCNENQCDNSKPEISLANRTSCLYCPNAVSPDKCEFTQLCDVNEVCYTELIRINGENRYRLGCVKPTACSLAENGAGTILGKKKRFLVEARFDNYCGKCCVDKIGNCNRDLCRTGAMLTPGASSGPLNNPPPQRDCEDIDTIECHQLLLDDPDACLNATIANYVCRRTCRCPTTPNSGITNEFLPKTDCFYESTRYKGVYRFSRTKRQCISWSDVYGDSLPHGLGFPEKNIQDAENKCRDPTGKGHPWCYTSKIGWEFCDVPFCEECYYAGRMRAFTGYVSKDSSGRTCQAWASYQGKAPLVDSLFPDGSVVNASRYCRDPFEVGLMCPTSLGHLTPCTVQQCPGTCQDAPTVRCDLIKSFVCASEYSKKTLCPQTCDYCDVGLLPPVIVDPPAQICADVVGANCQVLKDVICKDLDAAKRLCPQTCNVGCAIFTTSTVATTTIAVAKWSTWGAWNCTITHDKACFKVRFRNCSALSVSACSGDGETGVEVRPCDNVDCPGFTGPTAPTSATSTRTTQLSTTVSTIKTTVDPNECRDSTTFLCDPPDFPEIKTLICNDTIIAAATCPKTCGYCDGCKDVFNCSIPEVKDFMCADKTTAIKYCKQSCAKCDEKTIPLKLDSCKDPVDEGVCPKLDVELCICSDPIIRPLCQNFCEGACKSYQPIAHIVNSCPLNNGRKREVFRRTMEQLYDEV